MANVDHRPDRMRHGPRSRAPGVGVPDPAPTTRTFRRTHAADLSAAGATPWPTGAGLPLGATRGSATPRSPLGCDAQTLRRAGVPGSADHHPAASPPTEPSNVGRHRGPTTRCAGCRGQAVGTTARIGRPDFTWTALAAGHRCCWLAVTAAFGGLDTVDKRVTEVAAGKAFSDGEFAVTVDRAWLVPRSGPGTVVARAQPGQPLTWRVVTQLRNDGTIPGRS